MKRKHFVFYRSRHRAEEARRLRGRAERSAGRLAALGVPVLNGNTLFFIAHGIVLKKLDAGAGAPNGRRAALRPGVFPYETETL